MLPQVVNNTSASASRTCLSSFRRIALLAGIYVRCRHAASSGFQNPGWSRYQRSLTFSRSPWNGSSPRTAFQQALTFGSGRGAHVLSTQAQARKSASHATCNGVRQTGEMQIETNHRIPPNDQRPFEQRVDRRRPARRMNHPFKYFYRHDFNSTIFPTDPQEYIMAAGGYTSAQVEEMNRSFPALFDLSAQQQLHPKMQFLKHTLGQGDPSAVAHLVPPFYFGARLERIVAPRHAFLVWAGLPSGRELFHRRSKHPSRDFGIPAPCLLQEFMLTCRNSKRFAAMCQTWREESKQDDESCSAFSLGKVTA